MPLTTQGKEVALAALQQRRARPPIRIDNASLHAGNPMYYYCKSCGTLADILPENHIGRPKQLCFECQALKDCGWLE